VTKNEAPGTEKTAIEGEYITLGQFLKFKHVVEQGGMAKSFLANHDVFVNGLKEMRRGRKLRPGDIVAIGEGRYEVTAK
jgi:S4 domain protein YaaA